VSKKRDRKAQPKASSSIPIWVWGIGLLVAVGAILTVGYFLTANRLPEPALPGAYGFGTVTYCREVPAFAQALGFDEASIMDTQGSAKGLILYNPTEDGGQPEEVYQDPTWDDAGYLGPVTTDRSGNI
jgi:hypothetical protein